MASLMVSGDSYFVQTLISNGIIYWCDIITALKSLSLLYQVVKLVNVINDKYHGEWGKKKLLRQVAFKKILTCKGCLHSFYMQILNILLKMA
jgi:hypothetical protein